MVVKKEMSVIVASTLQEKKNDESRIISPDEMM